MEKSSNWRAAKRDLEKADIFVPEEGNENDRLEAITKILEIIPGFKIETEKMSKAAINFRRMQFFYNFTMVIGIRKPWRLSEFCSETRKFQDWCERAANFLRFKDSLLEMFPQKASEYQELVEQVDSLKLEKTEMLEDSVHRLQNEEIFHENYKKIREKWEVKCEKEDFVKEEIKKKETEFTNLQSSLQNLEVDSRGLDDRKKKLEQKLEELRQLIVETPQDIKNRHKSTKETLDKERNKSHNLQMQLENNRKRLPIAKQLMEEAQDAGRSLRATEEVADVFLSKVSNSENLVGEIKKISEKTKDYDSKILQLQNDIEHQKKKIKEMEKQKEEILKSKEETLENLKKQEKEAKKKLENMKITREEDESGQKKILEEINKLRVKTSAVLKNTKEELNVFEDALQNTRIKISGLQTSCWEELESEVAFGDERMCVTDRSKYERRPMGTNENEKRPQSSFASGMHLDGGFSKPNLRIPKPHSSGPRTTEVPKNNQLFRNPLRREKSPRLKTPRQCCGDTLGHEAQDSRRSNHRGGKSGDMPSYPTL